MFDFLYNFFLVHIKMSKNSWTSYYEKKKKNKGKATKKGSWKTLKSFQRRKRKKHQYDHKLYKNVPEQKK